MIMHQKNHDYGGGEEYKNFEMVARYGICPVVTGIMVRLSDKWSRLTTLLTREPIVEDEKVEDTIDDMINYLAIMKSYAKDTSESGVKEEDVVWELSMPLLILNSHFQKGRVKNFYEAFQTDLQNAVQLFNQRVRKWHQDQKSELAVVSASEDTTASSPK